MMYSQFDLTAQNRAAWNFGAKIGPIRTLVLCFQLVVATLYSFKRRWSVKNEP